MLRARVPERLLKKLLPLVEADPSLRLVEECRRGERRSRPDRRSKTMGAFDGPERRLIRNRDGRRVAERRAVTIPAQPPKGLSPKLAPHQHHLFFFERVGPPFDQRIDIRSDHLIIAMQSGDKQAFGQLYKLFYEPVHTYLSIALSDPYEAEDVAQQTFIKVFEALHRYEVRPGEKPFRAWLFRVVRNTGLMAVRSRSRHSLEPTEIVVRRIEEETADTGSDRAFELISDSQIFPLVKKLPLRQRQVVVLRYLLGLENDEIAEMVGLTRVNVRQLQHRALELLEQRVGEFDTSRRRAPKQPTRVLTRPNQVARARRFSLFRG